MTPVEAKAIQTALSQFGNKVKVVKQDPKGDVWKVTLPFKSSDGDDFRFYAFLSETDKKRIYLSDGGALLKSVRGCGEPQLRSIQELAETFGLSMMEDLSIMDATKRPMSVRIMSFLQAWCSVDGMLRIWKTKQEEVRDALRSAG